VADPKIKITADTSQAERAISDLEKSLQSLGESSLGVTTALAGITAAAGAMGYAILATLESAGQLIDASNAIGVSATNLQALQHAAAQAGVDAESLNSTLIRLSGNLGSAIAKGSGPAIEALKQLGIPLDQIARQRPDQQFATIASELNKMTNPAQRNALAIELLGKQGPRMLEVAKGIEAANAELQRMGVALTDLDVAALDEAGDAVDSLKSIFASGLKKAVADIAPYIVAIVERIKDAIAEAGGFEAVWEKIKTAIKLALNIALLTATITALARMVQGGLALAAAIRTAGSAMALFNAVVMRNPLMLVLGAAVALATVMGVDVVGAIGKAMGITEGLDDANKSIADRAQEIKEKNEANVEVLKGANEEQRKALEALNQTIIALEVNAQLQRDILEYGEEEANIRKVINTENEKLKKVGLELTQAQEQMIRGKLEEEASIKRLIELQKEQSNAAYAAIATQEGPIMAAIQKQSDFRLQMEGKTLKEIQKMRQDAFNNDPSIGKRAEQAMQDNVTKAIDAEIGKNNKMYALKTSQSQRLKDVDQLIADAELGRVQLTTEQLVALYQGRQELLTNIEREGVALRRQMQEDADKAAIEGIQAKLMAEQSGIASRLSAEEQATLQRIGQQDRQKKIVADRVEFEKKSDMEKAQFGIEQGAAMFSALGQQNKKAFELAKAFNIANAIMNTYMAATKALAMYPPPFNFIMAAGVVASGLAQVAQIRSQQYSGREKGGPVAAGMPYIVGEAGPEIFKPSSSGTIVPNGQVGGGGVNVNFTINAVDASGIDELLYNRREVIKGIISDAMLEKGQRF
jgi:hypothetical protein